MHCASSFIWMILKAMIGDIHKEKSHVVFCMSVTCGHFFQAYLYKVFFCTLFHVQ